MFVPPLPAPANGGNSVASPNLEAPIGLLHGEPPKLVREVLLHAFSHIVTQSIFFLDFERFRESALLPLPFGHPSRPLPVLLNSVYLWGLRKSDRTFSGLEKALREQSQVLLSSLDGVPPDKIHHLAQARILFAHYMFSLGNVDEARTHLQAAADSAFGYGLHRAKGDDPRSRAFWAIFISNNSWSAGLSFPTVISYSDPSKRIDAPWPMDPVGFSFGSTVAKYLQGQINDEPHSILALHAKGSLLFERATTLFSHPTEVNFNVNPRTRTAFMTLHRLIVDLISRLPTLEKAAKSEDPAAICAAHCLTYTAAIQLHRQLVGVDPESTRLAYIASKEIITWAAALDPLFSWQFSAFNAVPWRMACETMGYFCVNGAPSGLTDDASPQEWLDKGLLCLHNHSTCPLIIQQYAILRHELAGF